MENMYKQSFEKYMEYLKGMMPQDKFDWFAKKTDLIYAMVADRCYEQGINTNIYYGAYLINTDQYGEQAGEDDRAHKFGHKAEPDKLAEIEKIYMALGVGYLMGTYVFEKEGNGCWNNMLEYYKTNKKEENVADILLYLGYDNGKFVEDRIWDLADIAKHIENEPCKIYKPGFTDPLQVAALKGKVCQATQTGVAMAFMVCANCRRNNKNADCYIKPKQHILTTYCSKYVRIDEQIYERIDDGTKNGKLVKSEAELSCILDAMSTPECIKCCEEDKMENKVADEFGNWCDK